ncbi:39S ribosomal protein L19, mitochondrial [Pogonomyrmex barbatus]|uniref:Large ribosomal subunit protein bL19m n=1 Tax=Pogonomyrmex barbatus TaxID=144034 RepID=A0A6I9W9V1_9HYME|nr:39S ribosomal protein L19, mitochondrial [Pogonomyrmex barbatus]
MVVISRIFCRTGYHGLRAAKIRRTVRANSSTAAQNSIQKLQNDKITEQNVEQKKTVLDKYRFVYPEFLPDPNPLYRNSLREKLERMDMLARRANIAIPEFYVGSILAVTYSEPHAPGKVNKFVGICIERGGCGLRSTCLLRNVVDNQGIEVLYELYDPAIQKIECLRLEKRLDLHLRYLRDAPAEYSTFPFDMKPEYLPEGAPVPINEIKVKLNPRPWLEKWERQELKGLADFTMELNERRIRKAKAAAKPWEKYDLMKTYRETIPEEDQNKIFSEVYTKLHEMEIVRRRQKHKRIFVRPQKSG